MKQNLSYKKCDGVVPEENAWNEVKKSYGRRGSEITLSLGKQIKKSYGRRGSEITLSLEKQIKNMTAMM